MRAPKHRQTGMTLIEVLVAILIFSFGLLGFVGLQSRAIQYSVSAEDTNRAALLANEMASRMITRNTVDVANTSLGYPDWQARVGLARDGGLPNGVGSVSVVTVPGSPAVATIVIEWKPTTAMNSAAKNRYVTQVMLP